jgi:methyl-accepting chemotaxis protein
MFSRLSIKLRLSLVMAAGILALTLFLIAMGQYLYQHLGDEFHDSNLNGLNNLWRAIAETEQSAMAANFTSLTRNRALNKSLFKADVDGIKEAAFPTATRLKAMEIIDNLIVISTQGDIYYSLVEGIYKPPLIAQQALSSGKPQQGFEQSVDGRLVNTVAFPLYDRADLVGVGVYEKELRVVAEKIKAANGREILVYNQSHDQSAATTQDHPRIDVGMLADNPAYADVSSGDRVIGIASVPLLDIEKKHIGNLISLEDVTEAVSVRNKLKWMGYAVSIAILISMTVGVALYMKSALRPLDKGVKHMEMIASGDLSQDIVCKRSDEFKRLLGAMQQMNSDLRNLVGTVVKSSDQLIGTVGEVHQASDMTSVAVEEQKSDLEYLSTSLGQMAQTAAEVAQNINLLATTANDSKQATLTSNQVVKESVNEIEILAHEMQQGSSVMQSLEEKSQQIGAVLDVIKGIAEQTNLLALNAAIEAARAGEQGRGFAVVADEVRTLAGRTQESTTEIEEIIVGLQSGVNQAVTTMAKGEARAGSTSKKTKAIVASLDQVYEKMSEIDQLGAQVATAADQQNSTTDTMNSNVQNISKNADRTAEQCQYTSTKVIELTELSNLLKEEMARFKIG